MKCDELEEYYYYDDIVITPATHMYRVYHADEVDAAIAELKQKLSEKDLYIAEKDAEIARLIEDWNRLCDKYNKFIKLKQEFCDKFKDIELEITK